MLHIKKFTFNPFSENTWVVHNGHEALVIDPGCWNTEEEQELEAYLADNALNPVGLVLTHGHIDHVFGCAWMHKRFGLLPQIHEADLPILRSAPNMGRMFGVNCPASPDPGTYLAAGDLVTLGEDRLEVLFVPGHAPGHIALWCPDQRFVISGDVLFQQSIGRTDLPGGDTETLLGSIREQLLPLGDDVKVYCGHGPDTTIGAEKRGNPFLR